MSETAINESTIGVPVGAITLGGTLSLPPSPRGVVLFAHGSGSSRFSPRNRYVADRLVKAGFATLLFDLLTDSEEALDSITAQYRFDVPFLSTRLRQAAVWISQSEVTRDLPLGYFGASTGAAAAIMAAEGDDRVRAIVSRGGRPDLAGKSLSHTTAPVLLIVGGDDTVVIDLNRKALHQLSAPIRRMEIVPGATHLFEEPGTLETAAQLAATWFLSYLK